MPVPSVNPHPDRMLKDYLHIQLSRCVQLAVPVEHIEQVMTLPRVQICPIPGVPSAVLGVVDRGSKLLWVLELTDFLSDVLGLSPTPGSMKEELTVVVIRSAPKSNVEDSNHSASNANQAIAIPKELPISHLACAIAAERGTVSLNPAQFKPIPSRLAPLIGSVLSSVAWVKLPNTASVSLSPLGLLDVKAVFDALQTATTDSQSHHRNTLGAPSVTSSEPP